MLFVYKAIDKKGKKIKGVSEFSNRKEAISSLKASGLKVLDIQIKKETIFERINKKLNSSVSGLKDKLFQDRKRKKQMDSLIEELESLGYEKPDIAKILKEFTSSNYDIEKITNDLQFTSIQIEKVKSGLLNKDRRIKIRNVEDDKLKLSFGVPLKELIIFTEQLSILLDTEVDLIESLETVQRNVKSKKLKKVVDTIIYDLTKGKELSAAMKEHEDVFSNLYIAMVQVGENTNLSKALDDMAKFLNMRDKLKKEFIKASIYPGFIFTVLIAILFFMNYFIIPEFKDLFYGLEIELPLLTKFIFSISEHLGLISFGSIGIVVIAILMIWKIPYSRDRIKGMFDYLSLKIPIVNTGVLSVLMYQLSLTMAITLRNGISITKSLELSNRVVGNKFLKHDLNEVYYSIEKGVDISEAFEGKKNFTDIFKSAISSGDKSGRLNETLNRISIYYENELNTKLSTIIQIIIPFSIILLALIVAPFIIGIYLPITTMTQQLGTMR